MEDKERNNLYRGFLLDLLQCSKISPYMSPIFINKKIREADIKLEDTDVPLVIEKKIILPKSDHDNVNSLGGLIALCKDPSEFYQLIYSGILYLFNRNDNSYLDKQIKGSIAHYFTSKSVSCEQSTKRKYAGVEFNLFSPYGNLLDNLIAEIALVIGERELLTVALTSGVRHLKYSIDSKGGNTKLGSKIISKFENLIYLFESLEALER